MTMSTSQVADNLRRLFLYLISIDPSITTLEVTYEGSGDSGQIESIDLMAGNTILGKQCLDEVLPDGTVDDHYLKHKHWQAGQGWVTDTGKPNKTAGDMLDELAWDLAYSSNPGFEINEGGYGTVLIEYVPSDDEDEDDTVTVSLEHNNRYVEVSTETFEF
jgi:hypothetical protein